MAPILPTLLLSIAASEYSQYTGLNCYDIHGGTNIDDSQTAPTGLSVAQCHARCDSDEACHCIVFKTSKGKCFKRSSCTPAQCDIDSKFDTYVEKAVPPPSPPQPPAPSPAAPTRVLFVGNSYTYVHDTPRQFQNIAESFGDQVETSASTIGGCTLYAQQPSLDNTTAALLEQDWDYIVLQDYSLLPTIKKAREVYLDAAVKSFIGRKKQAKIVMFLTWGYHAGLVDRCPSTTTDGCAPLGSLTSLTEPNCNNNSDWVQSGGTFECMGYSVARGYLAARDLGVDLVAPCGLAWQVVRNSTAIPAGCKAAVDAEYEQPLPLELPFKVQGGADPNIELYIKDSKNPTVWDKHQSLAGCYLNALVFYATIFGKSTIGAAAPNASWGQRWGLPDAALTHADLVTLQIAAEGTVKECGTACGLSSDFIV